MDYFYYFKKTLLTLLCSLLLPFGTLQAQQTIIIGSSTKADLPFSSFDSLLTEIAAGKMTGQITIAFETGTYTFTKALNVTTPKFTSKDHLTITSVAQSRDSVTFSYSASTSIVGFILINNTNHVTFSHLNIHNSSTAGSHTVCINGPMEDVTFYKCNLKRTSGTAFATSGTMQTLSTNPLNSTSVKDNNNGTNGIDATVKWLRFIGNNIDNGCRNVIPMATTHRMQGLVFNDNTIFDNTAAGIMIYRADSVTCNRNHVMVKDKTSSTWSPGIQLSAITGDSVYGNFVSFMNQGATYGGAGINVSGVVNKKTGTNKSGRILIANNVILSYDNSSYVKNNSGSISVLSLSKVQADVYFNSVYNARTSSAPTNSNNNKTVYVLGIGDTCDLHLVGNQLVAYDDKNQHVMNISAATVTAGKIVSEYNNFYFMNGGTNYAYQSGTAVTSLANLLTLINDKGSISTNPGFADPTQGLNLVNYKAFTIVPNPGVTDDYQGIARGKITTMGAYTVAALDAALTDFGKTDFTASTSGTSDLYLTIMNAGMDTLYSATIMWDDGTLQKFPWKGKLALGEKDSVKVGTFKTVLGSTYRIKAWVTDPNSGKDGFKGNDTLTMEKYICKEILSGDYKIGPNQDFQDMNEVIHVLTQCGVKAPVRLLVAAGNYSGIRIIGEIPGADTTNTITVLPQSGAKVTIDGGSGQASLTLSNASHWVFEGITFGNTSNGLYGVMLDGANSDILFHNCNINASATATANSMAVYFHNASNSNNYPVNVRFVSNNIRGGVANIHMYYMAGKTANMSSASVTINDNTLTDAYQYGIYSYYYGHYHSISHNRITSRTGSGTYYGMYFYYYNNVDTLDANYIHVNATTGYGIYGSNYLNYSSYGGKTGTLSNNEIMVSASSTAEGIYLYYPYQTWNIYNNSIYSVSTGSVAYGAYLYNTSTSYKINFKNNLTVAKGAPAYPVYVSSATYVASSYMTFDYNNYYGTDANDSASNVGYAGSAKSTLADWQTATKQDSNSYNSAPGFVNISQSLELADYSAFPCPRMAEAAYDILNTPRGPIASVGCYSLEMSDDLDLSLKKFIQPMDADEIKCYGDFADVAFSVQNLGRVVADFSQSPLRITLMVSGAGNFRMDTVIATGQLASALTDTISLGRIPTMASGIYHLNIMINDTADQHPGNDTISLDYNVSHVNLPYDVDFSTAPTEFVSMKQSGSAEWGVQPKDTVIAPAFGTGYLVFNGMGRPGSVANAVFNSVNIYQTSNPKLTFWYAHTDEAVRDFLSVKVTNDEGATFTELGKVFASDTGVYWKKYEFDLSKFANDNCICIALQGMSFGGCNQYIDRIRITADKDIALRLLLPDVSQLSACNLQGLPLKAVVENLNRTSVAVSDDTIHVNVTGISNQHYTFIYNRTIGGFESDTLAITSQLDLSANGAYYFEACMQAIDDNTANDTIRDSSLIVMQDIAIDSVIGLDDKMFKLSGESVNVTAIAYNNGNIPVDKVILHMGIDGNEVVADTVSKRLYPGDTIVHPMSRPFIVPAVSKDQPYYFFELRTELACDADNTNDAINIVGQVEIPDSIDIQVLEITTTDQALGKTKLAPTVRVANIGNLEAENIVLHVAVVNDSNRVVESISEMISHLAINETRNHAFTMTYKVPDYTGKYTLRAYVEANSGDTIQSNDTLSKEFACYRDSVGIREVTELDWSLGQNIPNPASEVTAIPFTLPQAGQVRLSIMSANGQVICRQEIQGEAGSNRLELNTGNWAGGLYYYTMEYRGQRITRKMNIIK